MRIRVIAGKELDGDLVASWRSIQKTSVQYASPFLCPEFTQAVASARDDVLIAVLEDAGQVVGFFPYQRERFGLGRPVGAMLSDVHGVVCLPEANVDFKNLLRACKLTCWHFHHMIADQTRSIASPATVFRESCSIGLEHGLDACIAQLRKQGSSVVKDCQNKRRRMQKDHGEVTFAPHSDDPDLLSTLLEWKSAQYLKTQVDDILAFTWIRRVLEFIHACRTPTFSGMLSVLRIEERPVALHFGMRSSSVWNHWFPRHDETFARYSPGLILIVGLMECAPAYGVMRVDLGYGDETSYKARFRTSVVPLASGAVEIASVATALRLLRRKAGELVRRTPLVRILRYLR